MDKPQAQSMETDTPPQAPLLTNPASEPTAIPEPIRPAHPAAQAPAGPNRGRGRRRRQARKPGVAMPASTEPAADTDEEDDGSSEQGAGTEAAGSEFGLGDDDSEEGEATSQGEAPPPDPFYDPEADQKDESWLQAKRQGRWSDAILSCPGCFTTLCIDCQQHSKYKHQYRAMFVMNCVADLDQWVRPSGGGGDAAAGRKRGRPGEIEAATPDGPAGAGPQEGSCHPVSCEACGTQVGVVDPTDGLYILYNVFPSNA